MFLALFTRKMFFMSPYPSKDIIATGKCVYKQEQKWQEK